MKHVWRIVLVGCVFLISAHAVVAAEPKAIIKIRVADYPPQYYRDQSGAWTGLDVELARALVEEAGFTPQFDELPWSRALAFMKSGEIDLMTTLSKTPERSTYMNWIGPERISQMVLVVKKENLNLPIQTIDDLPRISAERGIKFGMQHDIYYGEEFAKRIVDPQFSKYFDAITVADLLPRKTRFGRILGFFEDKLTMTYQIKTNKDFTGLAIYPFVLQEEALYFGVSREASLQTLNKLEEAYQRLQDSGKLDQIRNDKKWW